MTESQRPAEDMLSPTSGGTERPVPPVAPQPVAAGYAAVPPYDAPPSAPMPTAAPLASVIAKPRSSTGRGTSLLMGLAAAIAIGGLAFAAGRFTAPAAAATTARGTGQFTGNGEFQGGGLAGGTGGLGRAGFGGGISLKGTVTAVSATSITVKETSGTEITIPLSSTTTYHTATPSSASAVTVGSTVSVTPGARIADANASPNPNASPAAGGVPGAAGGVPGAAGGFAFGAATDVTVTAP